MTRAQRQAEIYLKRMEDDGELPPGVREKIVANLNSHDEFDAVRKLGDFFGPEGEGRAFLLPPDPSRPREHPVRTQARRVGVLSESLDRVVADQMFAAAPLEPGQQAAMILRSLKMDRARWSDLRHEVRPEAPYGEKVVRDQAAYFASHFAPGALDRVVEVWGREIGNNPPHRVRELIARRLQSDPSIRRSAEPPDFDYCWDERFQPTAEEKADSDAAVAELRANPRYATGGI